LIKISVPGQSEDAEIFFARAGGRAMTFILTVENKKRYKDVSSLHSKKKLGVILFLIEITSRT
jgi:hypothetical protein